MISEADIGIITIGLGVCFYLAFIINEQRIEQGNIRAKLNDLADKTSRQAEDIKILSERTSEPGSLTGYWAFSRRPIYSESLNKNISMLMDYLNVRVEITPEKTRLVKKAKQS